MALTLDPLTTYLLALLRQVQSDLSQEPAAPDDPQVGFADALDSMGMVEFLGRVAEACGVGVPAIEQCVGRQFGTVRELAVGLQAAGLFPRPDVHGAGGESPRPHSSAGRRPAEVSSPLVSW